LKPTLVTAPQHVSPGEIAVLEVSGLHAGYGHVTVLRGVDLTLNAGEIVAVLGSNGVGKTTLNHNLCGLHRPFRGSVHFEGQEITGWPPERVVDLGMLQVPEGRKLFPNLTVLENLEMGSYRRGKRNRASNLERVFTSFPKLRERQKQLAGTLSGGEQQMVAIGRSLMAEPKLLIFDEPSLGLSPLLVEEMFKLIYEINQQGVSVLLVEQNVIQSLELAHRAYVVENGVIALSGPAQELASDPELKKSYLGL